MLRHEICLISIRFGDVASDKTQQASDNLIVKDYSFIIEIFDKFSFSGIFRGCLRNFN